MIYGQDEPMLFPVADLYDSGMMQMYINAAREQYNQARDDMKEFSKLYGDFFSPFSKDMEWVDAQTRGRVNDALTYMQANGIDPLRSAEGRALVAKIIRDTNVAGINQRKANAKMAEEYIKNRGTMIANGTYNPDYENYLLAQMGLGKFEDFDSSMGAWTRTSPSKYQDLYSSTNPWFKDINKNGYLYTKDGYDYFGPSQSDLQMVMSQNFPDFLNTDYGKYQLELARQSLGGNASDAEALAELKKNITAANSALTARPSRAMNDERKLALQDAYDKRKEDRAFERAKQLEDIKHKNAVELAVAKEQAKQNKPGSDGYRVWNNQYVEGISNAGGIDANNYDSNRAFLSDISNNIKSHQKQIGEAALTKKHFVGSDGRRRIARSVDGETNANVFIENLASGDSANIFNRRFGGALGKADDDGYYTATDELKQNIVSKYKMTRDTYGSRRGVFKEETGSTEDIKSIRPAITGKTLYTAYMKDGYIHQYRKCYDDQGNEWWIDLGITSKYTNPHDNSPVDLTVDKRYEQQIDILNAGVNKDLGSQVHSNNALE